MKKIKIQILLLSGFDKFIHEEVNRTLLFSSDIFFTRYRGKEKGDRFERLARKYMQNRYSVQANFPSTWIP